MLGRFIQGCVSHWPWCTSVQRQGSENTLGVADPIGRHFTTRYGAANTVIRNTHKTHRGSVEVKACWGILNLAS